MVSGEQTEIDVPDMPPVSTRNVRAPSDSVTYSKYAPKSPERCDLCMADMVGADGQPDPGAPAARLAKVVRKVGGVRMLLCSAHQIVQRGIDGYESRGGKWVKVR